MDEKRDIERRADSLLAHLAAKRWTALVLVVVAVGLFVAGMIVGARL